ncbi:hypothetical protein F5Y06DRAFT_305224 [Hypoxylon sp. FL0890]|nr:hypothetical protein F5Y06DRAFT_305224 [Hypoxylon sp. FL0890]
MWRDIYKKVSEALWLCSGVFLSFGPLWLPLFVVIVPYGNDYSFCWLFLMSPQKTDFGFFPDTSPANWYIGLCLILISAFLKINWFGAWLQIFITTRFCDRHWKPPADSSNKRIMQADRATWDYALPSGRLIYAEGTPRRCPKGCDFDLSDRVYHCTVKGHCFPLYDHYCEWLHATVYLRTMKPYCFVLFFLPLDAVYSFAVSMAALCNPSTRWTAPFVASAIASSLAVFYVLIDNSPDNLKRLVWKNWVGPERGGRFWTLAFKYQESEGTRLRLHNFEKNPWDLGLKENFRQVFGQHWWMWLFFWWSPERVSRYGHYGDRDLPYADFVTREFTDQVMPTLTSVAIDPPAPSSIRGERASRLQSARSAAGPRSQQRTDDATTSHVGLFARLQRGDRRHAEGHSTGHDLST